MSTVNMFLKKNKKVRENAKYIATRSLVDEKGNPLEWEIRPLNTKENEDLRESCMVEVQVTGKPGLFRPKLNTSDYLLKMIVASVVVPNLYDATLQDSYNVKTPSDLLAELIDEPGEYQDFSAFIQKFNGFNVTMEDKVNEVKN